MNDHTGIPKKVVIYGDSITEGLDLPPEERMNKWISVVEARSGGQLLMINEGKGGRMTSALDEFDAMLARQKEIDLLILAVGGADAARNLSGNCIPDALANVRTMVQRARASINPKLPILLAGPVNIRKDTLGPTKPIGAEREANLIALNKAYALLAPELNCTHVILYGLVPESSLAIDGVHPDSEGHRLIAEKMLPVVMEQVS
jgi:acyl-CoA thioesterase-1